jgi:putative FmdB family regulatory protein
VPTYQYQCTQCGEALEVRQSFTDDALTVCPACEGTLRKVFNAVGVVFKGSGFYRTDSRSGANGSSGTTTKTETKSDKKADTTSTSSSDSKSASTSSTSTKSSSAA